MRRRFRRRGPSRLAGQIARRRSPRERPAPHCRRKAQLCPLPRARRPALRAHQRRGSRYRSARLLRSNARDRGFSPVRPPPRADRPRAAASDRSSVPSGDAARQARAQRVRSRPAAPTANGGDSAIRVSANSASCAMARRSRHHPRPDCRLHLPNLHRNSCEDSGCRVMQTGCEQPRNRRGAKSLRDSPTRSSFRECQESRRDGLDEGSRQTETRDEQPRAFRGVPKPSGSHQGPAQQARCQCKPSLAKACRPHSRRARRRELGGGPATE